MKKRAFPISLTAVIGAAALAGSASAATTACKMVTAAEYRQVLGKPVKLSPGEGTSSCNVRIGRSSWAAIIPNLNPCNAAYIKRMLAATPGKQRVASLGPVGYVVVAEDGSVTSYAEKNGWFIAFQGLKKGNLSKAQAIKLASIALTRL